MAINITRAPIPAGKNSWSTKCDYTQKDFIADLDWPQAPFV